MTSGRRRWRLKQGRVLCADRHNPSGIQHDVALQLAGVHRKPPRRRPGVPHGQWSGLPGPDESDHPCGDETAGGSILAGLGRCLVPIGPTADG